jgi:hypothetical protein
VTNLRESRWDKTQRSMQATAAAALLLFGHLAWGAAGWRIDFGVVGPLRIGMTRAQAARALNSDVDQLRELQFRRQPEFDAACQDVDFADLDGSIGLQFEDGHITDIATNRPVDRTVSGLGVGNTFAEVKRAFRAHRLVGATDNYDEDVPQVQVDPLPSELRRFGPIPHQGDDPVSISIQFTFGRGHLEDQSRVVRISIGSHPIEGCN